MTLYHTSPKEIKKIRNNGLFGDILFFSRREYCQTTVEHHYTYEIEEDDVLIIDVEDFEFWDEIAEKEIINLCNCDEKNACKILSGKKSVWDFGGDHDTDWEIQTIQAKLAKRLGYDGCESNDEQGRVVAMCMTGKLHLLLNTKK